VKAILRLAPLLLAACGASKKTDPDPLLVTRLDQLPAAVGRYVTVRGPAEFNRKQPLILGVDVDADGLNPGIKEAEATGYLQVTVVTKEDLAREEQSGKVAAHRGPGTYYSLVDPKTRRLAKARAS